MKKTLLLFVALMAMLGLAMMHDATADGISFDCVDLQRCIALSPGKMAQQELVPYLNGNDYALAMLDFDRAEYRILYDVLYLENATHELRRWNGELLALCVPYQSGAMGEIAYRCYAAQEPIKFSVLFVHVGMQP